MGWNGLFLSVPPESSSRHFAIFLVVGFVQCNTLPITFGRGTSDHRIPYNFTLWWPLNLCGVHFPLSGSRMYYQCLQGAFPSFLSGLPDTMSSRGDHDDVLHIWTVRVPSNHIMTRGERINLDWKHILVSVPHECNLILTFLLVRWPPAIHLRPRYHWGHFLIIGHPPGIMWFL